MGAAGRCKPVFSTWLSIGRVRIETCTKGQTLSLHFKLLWVTHRAPSPTDLPVVYAEAHSRLCKQQNQTIQRTKRLLWSFWDWELQNALALPGCVCCPPGEGSCFQCLVWVHVPLWPQVVPGDHYCTMLLCSESQRSWGFWCWMLSDLLWRAEEGTQREGGLNRLSKNSFFYSSGVTVTTFHAV